MSEREAMDRERILEMTAGFQAPCVIGAAAELDLFAALDQEPAPVETIAERLHTDRRATAMLLDALVALELIEKQGECYAISPEIRSLLVHDSPRTILPGILHRLNVLRSWSQLAWVTKAGIPCPRQASIRGPAADRAVFVGAMHTYSGQVVDELVARLGPPKFRHLLDVGGASGTWTLSFLRAVPGATATVFDLPDAIAQARRRIGQSESADRIDLVAGDFYEGDLPAGADYAWLGAIVHQHSRAHNRALFAKVHAALEPGGTVAVRDVVMEPCRTRPAAGALFAINMLVNTESGGTFTFDELAEDLQAAGFSDAELAVRADDMNSVVTARKG